MMDSSQDFKSIQESIQNALVSTTRLANQIAAEDLSFQRTSNPTVADELDDASSRLLALTSSLLQSATKGTDVAGPDLEDADDVDVHWSRIVDVIDNLLEKADTCLDEYTGAIKRKTAPVDQPVPPTKKSRYALDQSIRRANVLKPQNAFEVKPNNLDTLPWKPLLTKKPHATISLDKSLSTLDDETEHTQFKHPYETEILTLEYPEAVFQPNEPIQYLPFESTTATYVDTFDGVLAMLDELKGATEIAIDTEHHDFRTYSGLLSLMQISTREKDWIVDTLQPWRHRLEVLNEVFADPNIVKVLHGAYMDIIWLQRDCGLYIVGLFDTFEAASALQYPGRSLAYLLKRFVDFDADKKYQLADWRIRPLPEEMFYYARSDTHYLLYIYDRLRNELLAFSPGNLGQDLMRQVLDKSKETSLRRYEPFVYDAESGQGAFGWFNMLIRQSSGKFSKEQFAVFRAIHKWRDDVARKEDESPLFVMNNATLFDVARRLPPDPKALHALLDSGSFLAKREVLNLFKVITNAIAQGANGPSVAEVIRGRASTSMGIGEVAQAVFPQLRVRANDALETKDLVSHSSRLWGSVSISSRWDSEGIVSTPKLIKFELPWAQFVQSAKLVDDANERVIEEMTLSEKSTVEHPQPKVQEMPNSDLVAEDSEFTLRAGMKRKVIEPESSSESDSESESEPETQIPIRSDFKTGPADSAEEIAIPGSDEEKRTKKARKAEKKALKQARRAQEKKERKERKKAEKLAKKAQNLDSASKDENDEDDEPFDYSTAKSVLNADRSMANGNRVAPRPKFNPYGMTVEGPKPARRMHGEKSGKSATFKR
ncbi:ribonuclease H-like domain-containing protein [Xylariaceae sp. FL1651]|nr:ribonuclease H-like domain-containing protein [Xylariaceae sp. FL1651]